MAIKYLHGAGVFIALVAALYWDKPVWLDKTYQDFDKRYDSEKAQRIAERKRRNEVKGK